MVKSARYLPVPLLLAFGLLGCRPSVKDVCASVRTSMQQTFNSDPRFGQLHLMVVDVTLIRDHDNSYKGIATVMSLGRSQDIPITVTSDGTNSIWEAEPGAFAPFMLDESNNTNVYSQVEKAHSI